MQNFGRANFAVAFRPTSAFPLDARCVFADLASAEAAAKTAEEIGSKNTIYHYGMQLLVSDDKGDQWYVIQRDRTLQAMGGVIWLPLELTAEQQAQAIENIGAAKAVVIAQGAPEIQPDVFYDFGEVSSLNITLAAAPDDGRAHEYAFEFIPKSDFTGMTITPEPKWAAEPATFAGKTHQVSILRGVGVMVSA